MPPAQMFGMWAPALSNAKMRFPGLGFQEASETPELQGQKEKEPFPISVMISFLFTEHTINLTE